MRPTPVRSILHRFGAFATLWLAAALGSAPLWGQVPGVCTTEVVLYVDKTESINARETAREVLNELNERALGGPGPITLTVFAFSGEVPIATFTGLAGIALPAPNLQDVFDQTVLQEPSSAVTLAPDYLSLFDHIEDTVRNRPNLASRRVFIVISDFSTRRGEKPSESSLPSAVTQRLGALRQFLVAGGKQRFLAIRTRPRQEPSPSLQNDLLGEIARNFNLVEDEARIPAALDELLRDDVPLQVQLTFNPTIAVYNLTISNPSCTDRTNIEYFARAADNNIRIQLPFCPDSLRAGNAGACNFAPDQIVLPPLPNTCLNVWLQATSQIDIGAAAAPPVAQGVAAAVLPRLVGTSNSPILAGNCVYVNRFEIDRERKLQTAADLDNCRREAERMRVPREPFVACLTVRGKIQNDARLRIRPADNPAAAPLMDRPLRALGFNQDAFHGGERTLPLFFSLPRWRSSWMCVPQADLAQRRLAYEITGAGGVRLANGILGRILPPHPGGGAADLLRRLFLPLLLLLFLGGVVANHIRTASLGVLDAVLFVLAIGILVITFLAYEESGLGGAVSHFVGSNSLIFATLFLLLLGVIYWFLFAKGFFDRKLFASVKANLISRAPLSERRRRRRRRTLITVSIVLVTVIGTILLLWLYPPKLEECRYSLVELPVNTEAQ